MMQKLRSRLSPALVLSVLAVVLGLGGTVYAAGGLNGKSIKKGSIPGDRLRKNTLTGKQIKESSLGTVPRATNATHADRATNANHADRATNANHADGATNSSHADNATNAINATNATDASRVGGLSVRKFSVKVPSGTGATTLVDVGGITLTGSCTGGNNTLTAVPDAGAPSVAVNYSSTPTSGTTFNNNGFASLNGSSATLSIVGQNVLGQLNAATTTGVATTISYMARSSSNFGPGEAVCIFAGTAISG